MDARYKTTSGYSFTAKELALIKQVQGSKAIRKYLCDWALSLPESEKAMLDELNSILSKRLDEFIILMLYTMNTRDKDRYGKIRLRRLNSELTECQRKIVEFYEADKDYGIDLFAMHEELKRKGIAPEQLEIEEVESND